MKEKPEVDSINYVVLFPFRIRRNQTRIRSMVKSLSGLHSRRILIPQRIFQKPGLIYTHT